MKNFQTVNDGARLAGQLEGLGKCRPLDQSCADLLLTPGGRDVVWQPHSQDTLENVALPRTRRDVQFDYKGSPDPVNAADLQSTVDTQSATNSAPSIQE